MSYTEEGYNSYMIRDEIPSMTREISADNSEIMESGITLSPEFPSPNNIVIQTPNDVVMSLPPKSLTFDKLVINKIGVNDYISSNDFVSGSTGWRIHGNGDAEFSSGTFRGTLTAPTGTIGGFTITSTELYGGIIKTAATVAPGSTGVIMDTDGLRGYDATLGLTFNLPTNGDAPTFSAGTINSSTIEIDTNAVMRTSSTVGDGTGASAGIVINSSGLFACEANQDLADANVKISINGTADIVGSIRGGQTDYNTGTGYFLGYSAGEYKFSVGSPTSNITWNGSELLITGNMELTSVINLPSFTVASIPTPPTSTGHTNPTAYE